MSGQDFACGSGDFSKFPSLMINLIMSRTEYCLPLLTWSCLNIRTCNLEMFVAPLSQMLDLSGSVRDLLSGQLARAIRHRQSL